MSKLYLPSIGDRDWFSKLETAIQANGSQVTIEAPNQDFTLLKGATLNVQGNGSTNTLHVFRAIFNDGTNRMQVIGGAGYLHHQAGEYSIKLPYMIGMASAISGYVDNSTYHGIVELLIDGQTINVKSYEGSISESDDWLSFVIVSPYLE